MKPRDCCEIDPSQKLYVATLLVFDGHKAALNTLLFLSASLYCVTTCKYIYLQFLSQPAAFIAFRKSPNEAIYFNVARSGA